mgnify:CR=1 FL=1
MRAILAVFSRDKRVLLVLVEHSLRILREDKKAAGWFRDRFRELQDLLEELLREGVEGMTLAVMGCVVNGPGESKLADIGISLPGTVQQSSTITMMDEQIVQILESGQVLLNQKEYDRFVHDITYHTMIHESLKKLMDAFNYDAHPMAQVAAVVASMAGFVAALVLFLRDVLLASWAVYGEHR